MTERDPVFGCELATGRLDKDGYAYHGTTRAHIAAWVKANGPVPSGMQIDHACRRRSCSALHHLEAVTKRENQLRKSFKYRAAKKLCAKGHSMEHALMTPEMGLCCRSCHREAMREHQGEGRRDDEASANRVGGDA